MSKIRRLRQELPRDLAAEILLRLEVKHVLRCKLVSRSFYSLIKSPSFASQHFKRTRTNNNINDDKNNFVVAVSNKLVYLLSPKSQVHLPYDHLSWFHSVFVVGSCNGLLCMLLCSAKPQLLLCNPATGEHRVVPNSHKYKRSRSNFGFGYDALSGDYKVLKIADGWGKNPHSVKVWSARTDKWTTNMDIMSLNILLDGRRLRSDDAGLFLFGNLYWIADPVNHNHNAKILFSVSLSDYSVHQITISDVTARYGGLHSTYLTVFRGCLAMFVRKISRVDSCYDIWVMEDKDGTVSWTKKLSVGPFGINVHPTRVILNGNFVMQSQTTNAKLFLYDPHKKERIELPFPYKVDFSMVWRVDETLVSLQNSDDHN